MTTFEEAYKAIGRPEIRYWKDAEPQGWRDLVPEAWRRGVDEQDAPISVVAGKVHSLPNADKLTLREFMDALDALELDMPGMEDYQGIRDSIQGWMADEARKRGALFHALERHPAKDIDEFISDVQAAPKDAPKTYYDFQGETISRQDGSLTDAKVILDSDRVLHIKKGHPEFNEWESIPEIIKSGEKESIGKNKTLRIESFIYLRREGDQVFAVLAAPAESKNFGKHVKIITVFKDNAKKFNNWRAEKKKAVASRDAGGNPGSPGSKERSRVTDNGEETILFDETSVKSIVGDKVSLEGPGWHETVRYEVRELSDIRASHNPENSFLRNPDYPAIAQERPYHTDAYEQNKVRTNAQKFAPLRLLTDTPTATDGPPVVTLDGIVLGGNSRAMTLRLVYNKHPESAKAYRDLLKKKAEQYGLDAAAIDKMKEPVLVRATSEQSLPETEMARRSRQYNQIDTQSLQSVAEGISRARFMKSETIATLAAGIKEEGTLAQYLDSAAAKKLVERLIDDGVLTRQELNVLTKSSGRLSDAGKAKIAQILRGYVLPDYDLLSSLPSKILDKIDATIPAFAKTMLRGEGWDLNEELLAALRFYARATQQKMPIEAFFKQGVLMATDPMLENPRVKILAALFEYANAKEVRWRMEDYIARADMEGRGRNELLAGMNETPESAFNKAFLRDIAFVGDERIGVLDPANNERDAALSWALKQAKEKAEKEAKATAKNKNSNGEKAARKATANPKISAEDAAKLAIAKLKKEPSKEIEGYRRELIKLDGEITVMKSKARELFPGIKAGPKPTKPAEPAIRPAQPTPQAKSVETEARGEAAAKPEAKPEQAQETIDMTEPDALLPSELRSDARDFTPRAMVEFDEQTGRAIITFFQSADLSSAPHEMFHIFRRALEKEATKKNAPKEIVKQWRALRDYFGLKDGEAWSVKAEEQFAKMGLRYLAEGRAPMSGLQNVFNAMRGWLMDVYKTLDNMGEPLSPEMRKIFDKMFYVPWDTADKEFRYQLSRQYFTMPEREIAAESGAGARPTQNDQDAQNLDNKSDEARAEAAKKLADEGKAEFEEEMARLEQMDPEARKWIEDAEESAELARVERIEETAAKRDELLRQATECRVNGV